MVRGTDCPQDQTQTTSPGENEEHSFNTKFVARQPILNRDNQVVAYELLFRNDPNINEAEQDDDDASIGTIHTGLNVFGLEELIGQTKAFINITQQLLLSGHCTALPTERVVVELLENIEPTPEVVDACETLKGLGYTLALDDFVSTDGFEPLLELADIVKVDYLLIEPRKRRSLVRKLLKRKVEVLAEKVETPEEFEEAMGLGCTYFQGYYFCKPQMVSAKEIPVSKLNYLQLIEHLNKPELDLGDLENTIKADVSLSMKLLKYLNSAAFGFSREINSIKHAMLLLGEMPLRKWATTIALASMAAEKPPALTGTSLARARFCESTSAEFGLSDRDLDLFLMGMFSVVDAMMDRPMADVISELPLHDEVKSALLGDEQSPIAKIYALVTAYERGDWPAVGSYCEQLGVPSEVVARLYLDAITWADKTLSVSR